MPIKYESAPENKVSKGTTAAIFALLAAGVATVIHFSGSDQSEQRAAAPQAQTAPATPTAGK